MKVFRLTYVVLLLFISTFLMSCSSEVSNKATETKDYESTLIHDSAVIPDSMHNDEDIIVAEDESGIPDEIEITDENDHTSIDNEPVTDEHESQDYGHEFPSDCAEGTYKLTFIIDPVDSGTADASPKGIDNNYCYDPGEKVTLIATPNHGWLFNGWKGEIAEELEASGDGTITMNADKTARALFKPEEETECEEGLIKFTTKVQHLEGTTLIYGQAGTITKTPEGITTADPAVSCHQKNETIQLTVTENPGFTFNRIKGKNKDNVTGSFPDFSITLTYDTEEDSEKTIKAEFISEVPIEY